MLNYIKYIYIYKILYYIYTLYVYIYIIYVYIYIYFVHTYIPLYTIKYHYIPMISPSKGPFRPKKIARARALLETTTEVVTGPFVTPATSQAMATVACEVLLAIISKVI